MLSRSVIYAFVLLGLFALLMGTLPNAYLAAQQSWNPTYYRSDREVVSFFNKNNITLYDNAAQDTLIFPQTGVDGYKVPLREGEQLSIEFGDFHFTLADPGIKSLWISHEVQHNIGGVIFWWTHTYLTYYNETGNVGSIIVKNQLLYDYSSSLNGSLYNAKDDTTNLNIVYSPENRTMAESWDNGFIHFMLSYTFNASATAMSMWSLLGQLLTFQSPDLGIPGTMGDILNAMIAIPMSALIIYILYKVIAGLVPMLSGGSGD